ncbi:MAG: putative ATPase (AAA+ superfamily) [Candidatus Accumulibacter appositus]|uniref:Putative ATPase (AAA+ superfamily) n=1 Tax=Candidatus Accumulibacter appositus TaxID=1454003 RepID=A0A011Q1B4_9PROT|nr:ATP-binding protein [Accumulibacter sp.]EXI82960.1 MAG: putative ATPase (AAA+ superfamily) [Candidatus Accumulibacter appositus]HRF04533.1 ATP-binding protein [Accumulibacter sp.]
MSDLFRQLASFLERAEVFLERIETLLPPASPLPDWQAAKAFRWRKSRGVGYLQAISRLPAIRLDDLHDIDQQKARIDANTRHFVAGQPANNVLLTGARGSGKSSLIKALLNAYAAEGLRVIEVEKGDLTDLPDIVELVDGRPERFIIFCDDLSFDSGDARYKALKVVLDGSIAAAPDNVLIYATSNRRHLMPEYFAENLESKRVGEEIHPGEAIEEKISLSERFGLWISFYPFDQEAYLNIVAHWLKSFGCAQDEIAVAERDALNWALERGSRSGRVAWQFARDWAGRQLVAPVRPQRSRSKALPAASPAVRKRSRKA